MIIWCLRAGQTPRLRSFTPIRSDVRAYHAPGAYRLAVQIQEHGLVRPSVGIDDRAVIAVEPVRAIDQQSTDAMRANMPEGDGRPSVLLFSPSWRVVVGIAVTHRAGPIVPSDGIYGFASAMTIGMHVPSAVPRSDKTI